MVLARMRLHLGLGLFSGKGAKVRPSVVGDWEDCPLPVVSYRPVAKLRRSSVRSRGTGHSFLSQTKSIGISMAAVLVFSTVLVANEDLEPTVRLPGTLGTEQFEELSLALIPAPDVLDPVLAHLVALLEGDVYDTLSTDELSRKAHSVDGTSLIPVDFLESMGRGAGAEGADARITLSLSKKTTVPAPYSLLGYHPGSVIIPKHLVLLEWKRGEVTIRERRRGKLVHIHDCFLWAVERGRVAVDIDAFVDRLLGGSVDDIEVKSLALFRLDGVRYAMAMGYNKKGKGRSGALNLSTNNLG